MEGNKSGLDGDGSEVSGVQVSRRLTNGDIESSYILTQ